MEMISGAYSRMNTHMQLPRIEIDQYECFATSGLKGSFDLAKEGAQLGYKQSMEYIAKTAQDGNRLAAIEKGGTPIQDIAKRDAWPVHEFGLGFMPKARPKITVKGSVIDTYR